MEDATFTYYVQSTAIGSRNWRDIITFSHHGLCCRDEARKKLPRSGSNVDLLDLGYRVPLEAD